MKAKNPIIRITRIEAVHRQLHTAISLYFQDGEPASIHTLASAAREILRVLNKKHGKGPMLLDDDQLPPDQQTKAGLRRFHDAITKEASFFKHSSSDPNESLEFDPFKNELRLIECVHKYNEITGLSFDLGVIFLCYIGLLYPDELLGPVFTTKVRHVLGIQSVEGLTKKGFLSRHAKTIITSKDKQFPDEL